MERTDVVVVGAGYAGLSAARRLRAAGRDVVVFEADDRVGGRTRTERVAGDWAVDLGGQWLAPGHTRFAALARAYGAATFSAHTEGADLLLSGAARRRYTGSVPPLPPHVTAALGIAIWRMERLSARVDLERPWGTPGADRLDATTVADWLRRAIPVPQARRLAEVLLGAELSVAAGSVSMLALLTTIRAVGGVSAGVAAESGGVLFTEGADGPALSIAAELGDAVRLGTPVTAVQKSGDGMVVGGVRCARVVVAVPPPLAGRIAYDPPMPADRDHLTQRMPMGSVLKVFAVYDRPFWREDGLSGQALALDGLTAFDVSRPGGPGCLCVLVPGRAAHRLGALPTAERRATLVAWLVRGYGPEATGFVDWREKVWADDPYRRGGYAAYFPPGVLTSVGHTLRTPVGAIHWAGSETAREWAGYVEGAIRSGERAADEVLALLKGPGQLTTSPVY